MRKVLVMVVASAVIGLCTQAVWTQEVEQKDAKAKTPVAEKETKTEIIKLKETEPFTYCALEMKGSYEQHTTAFMTLYGETMKQAVAYDDIPFGIYWNDPQTTAEEDLLWEIGFRLLEKHEVKEPLKIKEWKFTTMASRGYKGAFSEEEMGKAYEEIYQWIEKNGFVPAGPMMERYLRAPQPNEAGELCGSVEILVPVEKAKK
ncbi:MAG: GyrI-like domain-containing protein [bacterium]|nr:MAG: GyrI-like domain-containing protein [bacterium]